MKEKTKLQKFISFIEKHWRWLSIIAVVACFIIIPLLIVKLHTGIIYDSNTANIANTIGGIVSPLVALIAVVLTFFAFYIQFKANETQNLNFKIQQFESSFFELLRLHKEIVEINGKKGKLAFKEPNIAVRIAYDAIKEVAGDVQQKNYDNGKEPKVFCRAERDDYAFKLIFYGLQTEEFYDNLYDFHMSPDTVSDAIVKPYMLKLSGKLLEEDAAIPVEYKHGMRIYLSTYLNHLFHTIHFVHTREFLDDKQKEFYVEIIVSQLSPDEQVTLFYLSISSVGKEWGELIEKYSLIKNVPFIPDFEYRSHPNWDRWYPKVRYINPPTYPSGPENFNNGDEDHWAGLYC